MRSGTSVVGWFAPDYFKLSAASGPLVKWYIYERQTIKLFFVNAAISGIRNLLI
jgi:hypothetical protein